MEKFKDLAAAALHCEKAGCPFTWIAKRNGGYVVQKPKNGNGTKKTFYVVEHRGPEAARVRKNLFKVEAATQAEALAKTLKRAKAKNASATKGITNRAVRPDGGGTRIWTISSDHWPDAKPAKKKAAAKKTAAPRAVAKRRTRKTANHTFTVLIPYALDGTKWHPDEATGAWSVLSRGAFPNVSGAHAWAKKNIPGHAYDVQRSNSDTGKHTIVARKARTKNGARKPTARRAPPKRRAAPKPKPAAKSWIRSGYAFELDAPRGVTWQTAADDYWDTVMVDDMPGVVVGQRRIDGTPANVYRAGRKFYAQTGPATRWPAAPKPKRARAKPAKRVSTGGRAAFMAAQKKKGASVKQAAARWNFKQMVAKKGR